MYMLGNISMFLLLKETGLKKPTIFISVFVYSGLTVFFLFAYYYFTFNNYFFIPFFIYIMLKIRGSKSEFFIPGIMLAFSLMLGHIQYTCYYIIVYCIMCVIFAFQEKSIKTIIPMFLNIVIFGVISAAQLILLMRAGNLRSEIIGGVSGEFFAIPVPYYSILNPFPKYEAIDDYYNCLIGYIKNNGLGIFGILFILSMREYFIAIYNDVKRFIKSNPRIVKIKDNFIGDSSEKQQRLLKYIIGFFSMYFLMGFLIGLDSFVKILISFAAAAIITVIDLLAKKCFVVFKTSIKIFYICFLIPHPFISFILMVVYLAIKYFKSKKKEYSQVESVKYACIAAALFFLFFAMGPATPIAKILSRIPVFNEFRFLYKCEFIFLPLMVFIGAMELDKIKWHINLIRCTAAALSIAAMVNTAYYLSGSRHRYINNDTVDFTLMNEYIRKTDTLFEKNNVDKNNYRFLSYGFSNTDIASIDDASTLGLYMYTKNFPTAYEIFVIAGYDNTFTLKSFEQSNKIMPYIYDAWLCGSVYDTYNMKMLPDNTEEIAEFSCQMINNCVKYVMIKKDDKYTIDIFKAAINKCPELSIIKSFDGLNDAIIFEIEGVNSLAVTESGEKLQLNSTISRLNFNTDFKEETDVTLSFTYRDNYKCNVTKENGTVIEISPEENKYGFINLKLPAGKSSVELYYKDNIADIAMICAGITTILTFSAFIFTLIKKRKDSESE